MEEQNNQQAKVEIYYSAMCPYCQMAKSLLDQYQVNYELYNVLMDQGLRQEARDRSQRSTIPQIFINDQSIGGFDDLNALEQSGQLPKLLSSPPVL